MFWFVVWCEICCFIGSVGRVGCGRSWVSCFICVWWLFWRLGVLCRVWLVFWCWFCLLWIVWVWSFWCGWFFLWWSLWEWGLGRLVICVCLFWSGCWVSVECFFIVLSCRVVWLLCLLLVSCWWGWFFWLFCCISCWNLCFGGWCCIVVFFCFGFGCFFCCYFLLLLIRIVWIECCGLVVWFKCLCLLLKL